MATKDLLDFIDFSGIECLNQKPTATCANALKQGYRDQDELCLESDADEQLILNIPFNQKVKLQSIAIKGPADSGPRTIRLYANRGHLGFSDVGATPSSQDIELSEAQVTAGETIPLKQVKFAFVTNLSVFIENNQGDEDVTKVSKIMLSGQAGESFNVANIKKIEDE